MHSVTRCDDGRFVNEAPDFLGSFGTAAEAIDAAKRAVDKTLCTSMLSRHRLRT